MSTSKSELDPEFLARQRQQLLKRRDQLGKSARDAETEETRIKVQSNLEAREFEDDAQKLDSLETQGHLVDHATQALARVERALKKMEEGTYGYSDVSGQRIPEERLKAMPEATTTLAEQQASERS
jgi:DnaK suppressor protein